MFDITIEERINGALSKAKLASVVESIKTTGFAVIGDLVSEETRELLTPSVLEDVAIVRTSGKPTPHEQRTAQGHLQLGLRRHAPYVRSDIVANRLIESVVAAVLGQGAWLGFYNGNVNCPHSGYQPLHFDRPYSWTSRAAAQAAGQSWPPPTTTLSCSIALTAITELSGATEIYPGTHHETAVTEWPAGERPESHPELVEKWGPPKSMIIPAGGVCFRDPRMWHRGVPNTSDTPRPMIALTYHSKLARHWRGLLVKDLDPAHQERCDDNPNLRLLENGEPGDGRLVFHASARPAFEPAESPHGIIRNVRFVEPPGSVDHLHDAHMVGGARVLDKTLTNS